ncbi:hypothetical protein [Methyloligella halotolerans]|uniref:hypothetical protein n=1 Tax=Methyloligella halotolerans TaxID=1177755 RepID=UPI00114CC570|nr:hypothetical protein [Methyloligella halotolerans]
MAAEAFQDAGLDRLQRRRRASSAPSPTRSPRSPGQIADTKVKLAQEANSERRIALEEKVVGLEVKRDVLVAQAQSGDTTPSLIQAVFAAVAAVWFLKVVVFDTVLHAWTGWSTPELPPLAENVLMAVVGFYFVTVIARRC